MDVLQRFVPALGRFFLAALFLGSGLGKLGDPATNMAYVEQAGLPMPALALWGAAFVEIVGGLLLLIGLQTRFAAAALAPSSPPSFSIMISRTSIR